ncbi:MAG: universal stress protein [Deltaproteobacteria bacterium]|nr:universal stress protein [Deltaproteobacteria bacterium]
MATFKKVLIPFDGSECSRHAAKKGIAIAKDEGADIVGIKVIGFTGGLIAPSDNLWKVIEDDLYHKADEILDDLEMIAKEEGVTLTREVREGSIEREVLDFAKSSSTDLIVMGATGKSGVGKYLGRTADRILRDSSCPVMVVH